MYKKFKKFISAVVIVGVMIHTPFCALIATAQTESTSTVQKEKAESIAIKTAEELMNMKSDGVYHLAKDIDLSGVKWHSVRNFEGTFDGKGYEIKNLESNTYGLFAELKSDAVIKNVKLTNVKIMSKYKTVGGIAAVINGSVKNVHIDNCYVSGVVASCLKKYKKPLVGSTAGAIVGKNNSASSVISNCYSNAVVCAERQVGGIVGINKGTVMNSGFGGTIENSQNIYELACDENGAMTEAYLYLYCYGGICGFNYGKIQNCLSSFEDKACGSYGGGIVGASMKNSKIIDCINLTKMWLNDDMYPGLIAGYASKKSKITNCYTIETERKIIGQTVGKFNIKAVTKSKLASKTFLNKLGNEWCIENSMPMIVSIKDFAAQERMVTLKGEKIHYLN